MAAVSMAAPADLAKGAAWLQAQVQADGQFIRASEVANTAQAQCEAATTLLKLSAGSAPVQPLVAAMQSTDTVRVTESLACQLRLQGLLGQAADAGELDQRRVAGQGYAAYTGYENANALDTGWALATRWADLDNSARTQVLAWLQAHQQADGSFVMPDVASIPGTAVVLRGLKEAVPVNAVAADIAQKAANYLLGQWTEAGQWQNNLASTALVYEAIHPYTAASPQLTASVQAYLLSAQQTDGAWAGDPYITALALRALALAAQPPLNPTQAGLRVRFVDARTAAPLPGVSLESTGAAPVSASADAAGRIDISGLEPGTYPLRASAPGYSALNFSASPVAGQILDLGTLQMIVAGNAATAVASGIVRDRDSNLPLADASVTVQGQNLSAATAADGSYLINNILPGTLTLSVSKAGYQSAGVSANVPAGQAINFSPLLASVGGGTSTVGDCRLQGRVTEAATQQALAGVSIQVSGASTASAVTDAAGRYSIAGLSNGLTQILASKTGYDSAAATTRIACDGAANQALDFSPRLYLAGQSPADANTAGLSGIVLDAGTNLPIAGATLLATLDSAATRGTQTAADGRFNLAGLDGTTAQLQIQAPGYQGMTLQYVLTLLQNSDIGQIRLRKTSQKQLLPDLKLLAVTRHTATTDAQSLRVGGAVQVQIINTGEQTLAANATLLAFSDLNRNELLDPATDTVLGQATLTQTLAPGATATVLVSVSGLLPFRDAPIHVVADPYNEVVELNKNNNVRSTAQSALQLFPIRDFQPRLKWEWNSSALVPDSIGVMSPPLAIPTRDTNGDGKIDANDDSDIVVTTFPDTFVYPGWGTVRILNGRTGADVRAFAGIRVSPFGSLAAADLDGDGSPEIVAANGGNGLPIALRMDGSVMWTATQGSVFYQPSEGGSWSAPVIADLDGDGVPEVIQLRNVYNGRTGAFKWVNAYGYSGQSDARQPGSSQGLYAIPVVADLFGTGKQNVIWGASVFDHQGNLVWINSAVGDGHIGVADFDGDGQPELVHVSQGAVSLLDRFGVRLWGPVALPGSSLRWGGPPTIADFDGDGVPDIGVAGDGSYTVLRADGSVLWTQKVKDGGSGMTGSTAFDFDGSGAARRACCTRTNLPSTCLTARPATR